MKEQDGNVIPFSHERAGTRRTMLLAWPASPERTALVRALEARGHRVRTVDDSHATLTLMELNTWYAAVLHEEVPDGGGLWIAKMLAYARVIGSIADSPLILVTSIAGLAEEDWRATGISHCLDKSPSPDQVLAAVSLARAEPCSSVG